MKKNHSLVTFSNFKNLSLDNSLISEFIKENLEKENSYGMIKFKKNLKSAEWLSFTLTTWNKSKKSELVIFSPFLVLNVQLDKL